DDGCLGSRWRCCGCCVLWRRRLGPQLWRLRCRLRKIDDHDGVASMRIAEEGDAHRGKDQDREQPEPGKRERMRDHPLRRAFIECGIRGHGAKLRLLWLRRG